MRAWLINTLKAMTALTTLVPAASIYPSSAIGVPGQQIPVPPFIVVRGQVMTPPPFPSIAKQQRFLVWVHNVPGSWLPVTNALTIIRTTLPTMPQQRGAYWVADARFESESDDLYDDALATITRYSSWFLTSHD